MGRLPLPTIILRWDLRLIYQNRAARDFCAVWEKGPEEARRTKARSPIPSEILDRCRVLKQRWARTRRANALQVVCEEEQVHHPRRPHLRATIHLKQLKLAGVARPHFLVQCEDLRRQTASGAAPRELPFAVFSPTYEPRTGSCRACVRWAEQPGDCR